MKVIKIESDNPDYHGCGQAIAAITADGKIAAIRYRDDITDLAAAKAELSKLGKVKFGMCSCFEFCYDYKADIAAKKEREHEELKSAIKDSLGIFGVPVEVFDEEEVDAELTLQGLDDTPLNRQIAKMTITNSRKSR
jgi:hypothetical protein